jgi:lipopolysaccharide biosynthesis glycosyltransferase
MMHEDQLKFYPAEECEEAFELASELKCDFSPAMIWRAWLPDYLNGLEKVLSLDCDLICFMDLALVWNTDLTDHCLSAPLRKIAWNTAYHEAIRTPPERYFRNGFCLMNLKAIRKQNDFTEGRAEFLSRSIEREAGIQSLVLWEQSLFNYYFSNVTLPMHINLIPVERMEGHPLEKEYRKALKQGSSLILDVKGWHNLTLYSNEFWRLLLFTPWRDVALSQLRTSNF